MLRRALSRFNRILGTFTCPPILNSARVSSVLRSRPRLESLETRDTPTTFVWSGMYGTDATDYRNWLGGATNQLPGSEDEIVFVGQPDPMNPGGPPVSTNCDNLSGEFATIHITSSYTATVTFSGPVLASNFTMEGGAISQPTSPSNTDLAVGFSFNWTGGTLNSSNHLANVTLSGATALIAPAGGSTVTLGSNLALVNGATATLQAGTVNITNDGEEIDVGANCGVTVDPGSGLTAAMTSLVSTKIQVGTNASWTMKSGTFTAAGRIINAGTVTLMPNTIAFFPGVNGNDVAYLQNSGATYLYGTSNTTGLWTGLTKQMEIAGGVLDAIFDDGQFGYNPRANIVTGQLNITGGDIYINYVPGVTHTVYGQLFVVGDVVWTGGTYHPYVEGNVNAGGSPDYSDFWSISGSLTIGQTAALDPTSVVGGLPAGATSGYEWNILTATNGITAAANTPSYDTNVWTIDPFQNGALTTWKLEAL